MSEIRCSRLKRMLDGHIESPTEADGNGEESRLPSLINSKRHSIENEQEKDHHLSFHNNSTVPSMQESTTNKVGLCVECEAQSSVISCEDCQEEFCQVCFQSQHRKGKRAKHKHKTIASPVISSLSFPFSSYFFPVKSTSDDIVDGKTDIYTSLREDFTERAKYIPLRLTFEERKLLRLLQASLNVNNYTDKIDIHSTRVGKQRTHLKIMNICALLSGLVLATDKESGERLIQVRDFHQYKDFYQRIFELGRRHKIMNPEKLRSEYGKLMYLLQDAVSPEIRELLEFSCKGSIKTVYSVLSENSILELLSESDIEISTRAIVAYDSEGQPKNRSQIRKEVEKKNRAVEYLSKTYSIKCRLSKEEVKLCLYAIGDNNSFLVSNRDPIDRMIGYLKKYFSPTVVENDEYSLSIFGGKNGARLTHDHSRQYHYVLQSLTLWREITNDMFRLWYLADDDLLSEVNQYDLKDTGQGLHRVQPAPKIAKAMQEILYSTQKKVGYWVGSSVIHLGDSNVPNAFMFIDKYTQVPRILNPIVITLDQIPEMMKNPKTKYYIEKHFGSQKRLRKEILVDFFRYAFDGSGADNFFDAGSCIDGRLTSAWNWCSKLEKKPFYSIFKLAGFLGFDGNFQK